MVQKKPVWYATDLSRWDNPGTTQVPENQDLIINGKAYRQLSPEYFAWMYLRMKQAQEKNMQGILPASAYNQLKNRFNAMQVEAIQCFGENTLLAVLNTLEFQKYEPPCMQTSNAVTGTVDPTIMPTLEIGIPVISRFGGSGKIIAIYPADEDFPGGWVKILYPDGSQSQTDARYITDAYNRRFVPMTYTDFEKHVFELAANDKNQNADDILPDLNFPLTGNWKFSENVDLLDFLKVWEIKDAAIASGWSYADLFQNRGEYPMPCGQDYGLVCFVHGRIIGEITTDEIELISKKNDHGRCLKFQRPRRKEIQDGTTAQEMSECQKCAS